MALPTNKKLTMNDVVTNISEYDFIITNGALTIDTSKFEYYKDVTLTNLFQNRNIKALLFLEAESNKNFTTIGDSTPGTGNKILNSVMIPYNVAGGTGQPQGELQYEIKVKSKRDFLRKGEIIHDIT